MIVAVAERLEHHDGVHHAREDRPQAVAAVADPFQDPGLGLLQRGPPERLPRQRVEELEHPVPAEEKILPGEELPVEGQIEIGVLGAVGEELVELLVGRQVPRRLEMIQDGERHNHAAAPRRHLVNIKIEPVRQEDDLRRDDREIFPRELAEEGEEELGVGVRLRDAAETHDGGVGLEQPGVLGEKPDSFRAK